MFGGGDAFGQMQAAAPQFPSFIVFEDNNICIGFNFRRENQNTHIITTVYKNKTQQNLKDINM